MRTLGSIDAGQARFLDECGSWVGIAGKVCCDFEGEYASSVLTRRGCRMSRPSGACFLGDDNDDVPDWSKGLENMPPERRDSLGGAGFSSETGHSIGYDDRVVGCDP